VASWEFFSSLLMQHSRKRSPSERGEFHLRPRYEPRVSGQRSYLNPLHISAAKQNLCMGCWEY
jgi:hypothetical protein